MMNCPGWAFWATSGASMTIRVTVGLRASFSTILYILLLRFLKRAHGRTDRAPLGQITATHSISTSASFGSAATWNAARAG